MKKVDVYSGQVKYSGSYEDYTAEELYRLAMRDMDRGMDFYDHTEEMEDEEALEATKKVETSDLYPCNQIALVKWYQIYEEEEEY